MRRALCLLVMLALCLGVDGARADTELTIYYVPTVGGAHIRVQVLRDPALDPQPVLLTYSPYFDDPLVGAGTGSDELSARYVPRGIARAWGDLLGTNGSSGCWDYGGREEQQSGVDLVNYLSRLPWSNGKVGMIGVSYDGTTANMVAARGPDVPGLAAIVPLSAISRWYEYAYYQGARYNQPGTPPLFDLEIARHPSFDSLADPRWQEATTARAGECGAIEHTMRAHTDSPIYDDFWLQRDYLKDASKFRVPVLLAHGWQDYNVKQQQGIQMFEAISEDIPGTIGRREGVPFKILYTFQGGHDWPHGEAWYPLLDAFLDRTLRGVANGIENGPRFITQPSGLAADGTFSTAANYPPSGTKNVTLQLRAGGTLALDGGSDGTASYTDLSHRGARSNLDAREPTNLLYVSPPLAANTRIAGSVVLDALLSVDRPRGQLDPILYEIEEGGTAHKIAPAMMNLRYRNGLTAPQDLPVGVPVRATAIVKPQDYIFSAGSRIGISIQSSNEAEVIPDAPATYTIFQGDSVLRVPIVAPPSDLRALFA